VDEKTRLLVSIGAAVAANCVSCFQHFWAKTEAAGLTREEIKEVVELADQIKNGARISIMNDIRGIVGGGAFSSANVSEKSCCG
jgi:AhpD family alkylhydroperoxidase